VVSEWALARRSERHAAFRVLLVGALVLLACALACPASAAQMIRGEVGAAVENGFARLIFTFTDDVDAQVKVANGIVMITFNQPVYVVVDKLDANATGYIGAARRDPDGKGIRIALARKVTVNSMAVAEKLFVDLLPDTWTGLPPGLPREVIEDLARRAREADKKLRQQRALARQSRMKSIRLRVASQPTFTRYVFDLPELVGVAANTGKNSLTVTFDALLNFDLADARAMLPATVGAIDSKVEQDTSAVRFTFTDRVDVRTFREDLSFVVDVTPMATKSPRPEASVKSDELSALAAELAARANMAPANVAAPRTVPARPPAAAPAAEQAPPPPAPDAKSEQDKSEQGQSQDLPLPDPSDKPAHDKSSREEAPRESAPKAAVAEQAAAPTLAALTLAAPPPAPASSAKPADAAAAPTVQVAVTRQGDNLRLTFPFAGATPAAMFSRADTLWLVFDTPAAIAIGSLDEEARGTVRSAQATRHDDVALVRIKLARPRLVSAASEGPSWTVAIGEVIEPPRPLGVNRNIVGSARASITIPIDEPQKLHRLEDPEAGDALLVVTALAPARGLVKGQDFVDLRALVSSHGVVLKPIADDLAVELAPDKVVISRPAGLTLSTVVGSSGSGGAYQPHVLDAQNWSSDRRAEFQERNSQLVRAAAEASPGKRAVARADLARFYLARGMGAEAKGVLDVALAENPPTAEDPTALVLRAVANITIGRFDAALKDLGHPFVGNQYDAQLWRALAYARQSKWKAARLGFRDAAPTLETLPLDMQRTVLKDMVRASLESGDVTSAVSRMQEFEAVGIPHELEPALSVLSGRLAEGLGRVDDALRSYQAAADSWDRPASAQGRLRALALQSTLGKLPRAEAITTLETLTTVWRGDETEVEALAMLAHLYTQDGRFRDAFHVMRTALAAHPDSEATRRIQEEAAGTFDSLFLAGKGDGLAPIDALALFYDFRDLTPIGRRGDEMIRRLADRLVAVDLLDQAAELLQHQVDHRLQGAARAQVAGRLAFIYLMNRKPDRALAALRATRSPDFSSDLRNQRLLLEARALSDLGRPDVAFEVVANVPGPEAIRLRADVMWAGKRWGEAAEQIELLNGERWKEFMNWVSKSFEVVLVDAPPILPMADCELITAGCDSAMLVVRALKTSRELLGNAVKHVDSKKFLGIVFNGSGPQNGHGYYGYGTYDSHVLP